MATKKQKLTILMVVDVANRKKQMKWRQQAPVTICQGKGAQNLRALQRVNHALILVDARCAAIISANVQKKV